MILEGGLPERSLCKLTRWPQGRPIPKGSGLPPSSKGRRPGGLRLPFLAAGYSSAGRSPALPASAYRQAFKIRCACRPDSYAMGRARGRGFHLPAPSRVLGELTDRPQGSGDCGPNRHSDRFARGAQGPLGANSATTDRGSSEIREVYPGAGFPRSVAPVAKPNRTVCP